MYLSLLCMFVAHVQVLMLSQGASKVNVGLVVQQESLDRAVKALHSYFIEREGAVKAPVCASA